MSLMLVSSSTCPVYPIHSAPFGMRSDLEVDKPAITFGMRQVRHMGEDLAWMSCSGSGKVKVGEWR